MSAKIVFTVLIPRIVHVGLPIKTWMQKWTYKSGHPIVSVDIDSELQEFIVKQNPSDGSKCEDNNSWWIPLHYATKVRDEVFELFQAARSTFEPSETILVFRCL